jgi:hypothetical protein
MILESLSHPFYVLDANDYTIQMANSAAGFDNRRQHATCYQLTHNRHTPCEGIDHVCPLEQVKATRKPVVCVNIFITIARERPTIWKFMGSNF